MERFALQKCIQLTKSMLSRKICRPFSHPIEQGPEYPDYFSFIKKPMDLKTVMKKLEQNLYQNVEEWINDVDQIWKNAFLYFDKTDLRYLIAIEMRQWVYRKLSTVPLRPTGEWLHSLQKTANALYKIASCPPARGHGS
ncbi:Bromodomain containing protein [Histomonas meleagridis]|uniref:Bromodomain containing protein n=1 Tax=Histomonas meleagridis TaxID=135588 RepID=UPI003559A245|nr:Bromodomain containing protein [Histomonas meleagridis]KAH0799888.1 Bromodomain containing protein [Histomonas meleagridis]